MTTTLFILIAIIQPIYISSSVGLRDFQNRWAFLVGIGEYPSESGIGQLNSPVDDVKAIKQMLIQYGGFSPEHIIILSEHQATYRGVNEAFQRLANQVQPEDLVLFYFSGRGSRVPDNVFIDSETDKMDECFLLYDTILEGGMPISNYIRDDEIGKHLSRLRAKQSVVIIDACYRGNNAVEKGVTTSSETSDSIVYNGMSGDFLPFGTIVLEACAPDETTLDWAFTSLLTELPKLGTGSDGIITIKEFHAYAENRLGQQKPQLVDPESRAAQVSLVHPLLKVISQPESATIFVGDKERGTTPKRLILPIGLHKLEVRKRGYHVAGNLIEIAQPGTQPPIDITLIPVRVTGEVRFRNPDLPVKGATVTIMGARNIPPVTTDEGGRFVFNDWSQNDLSESDKILISDERGRYETKSLTLKDLLKDKDLLKNLDDFMSDIPLGAITVDRRITFTVTVANADKNIPMPNAVVQLDQQQIIDDNRDGVFETPKINPPNSMTLQVSQEGYETTDGGDVYEETITIILETYKYTRQVQLKPALNTYSVEVKNQFRGPVPGVTVILNNERLEDITNLDGIAEVQQRLAPDEEISLQLQKDGYKLFNLSSIRPKRLGYHRYRLPPIQLDVIRILLLAVDESDIPLEGVQINTKGLPTATTDANGEATITLYRPPNKEISLDVAYKSREHQKTEKTILQSLEGGRFKILEPGFAEAIGTTLKIHLPIPPEVGISLTVQEQDRKSLPEMTVKVNGKAYSKTSLTGKIEIRGRIDIVNMLSMLKFERYGESYKPQRKDFVSIGTNTYLVTLQILYGNLKIEAKTEEIAGKEINLPLNAKILLDEGTLSHRLPATIQVFPGTHQIQILIGGISLYSELLKVPKDETIPIPPTLSLSNAWRVCLKALKEDSNDVKVLWSAEELAKALGRRDLALTFRQRRERLE